jgi:ABC-type phosphate/phosphonate transport system substrate-binding protein
MRLAACLCLALIALALSGGTQPANEPVRIFLTKKAFPFDKPADIEPQLALIADEIGRRIGRTLVVDTGSELESVEQVREDLTSGVAQFVITDGLDFVQLRSGKFGAGYAPLKVRPVAAVVWPPDNEGQKPAAGYTRAVVLTRKDLGLRTFADLRHKRLVFGPRTEEDSSMLFLDTLVQAEGSGRKEDFFGTSVRADCEDAALISLLNDKADATCMIEEILQAKQLVCPALDKQLNIAFRASEPFPAYTCLYLDGKVDADLVQQIRGELLILHKRATGKKLLEMFQVRRFVEVEESGFDYLEQLLKQYVEARDRASAVGGNEGGARLVPAGQTLQ